MKYVDIIYYFFLLHLILIFSSNEIKINKRNSETQQFFIEDKPHDGEIDNELVLNKLVDVVNTLNTENSFSIGLNAPWGYGKSTFLHRFFQDYQKKNKEAIIFWYSIWKNKGSSAIIDNFFQLLANQLKPYSGEISGEIDNYVDEILHVIPGDISNIILSGKNLIVGKKSIEDYYEQINNTIKKIDRQIIVLLDDLDRLENDEILDSFKLIRSLSDFKNVIFIAGYNRSYITKTCGDTKKDYINKIFQVEINLLPFNEKTIRSVILNEIRISYPISEKSNENQSLYQGFYGLFDKPQNYIPNLDDLLSNARINSSQLIELNWFRFLPTYRDIKRFINEFKFNYQFVNEEDIVTKEYILLKLLFFKFRELQTSIFNNLEEILTIGKIDEVNQKIQTESFGYGNIYVFDVVSYEKLTSKLIMMNYSQNEILLICSVFHKLFGDKAFSYYSTNQNSIARIYHTNTYVRNDIAGAKYKLSDFSKAYETMEVSKLIEEIENYTPQTKSMILYELKQFLLKQELESKSKFLYFINLINSFLIQSQTLITEDQSIINIIHQGLQDFYKEDKTNLIVDLIKQLKIPQIGYLDKLLSDINLNEKRKERSDLFDSGSYIEYSNVIFSDEEIKNILIEKLKYCIENSFRVNLILEAYLLYTAVIACDHKIVKSAIGNSLIRNDIEKRTYLYFQGGLFDFIESSNGTAPKEYREYKPKPFLSQIFAPKDSLNEIKYQPRNTRVYDSIINHGYIAYIQFMEQIEELNIYTGEFTQERFNKIKQLLKAFRENNFKPLNHKQFTDIWPLN